MTNIKVGDKVRILTCIYGDKKHEGRIGTVSGVDSHSVVVKVGRSACSALVVQKIARPGRPRKKTSFEHSTNTEEIKKWVLVGGLVLTVSKKNNKFASATIVSSKPTKFISFTEIQLEGLKNALNEL